MPPLDTETTSRLTTRLSGPGHGGAMI